MRSKKEGSGGQKGYVGNDGISTLVEGGRGKNPGKRMQ